VYSAEPKSVNQSGYKRVMRISRDVITHFAAM
jgi:hypothetical protein